LDRLEDLPHISSPGEIIDQDIRGIETDPGAWLVPFLEPWVVK
jgi:hypothetical protein